MMRPIIFLSIIFLLNSTALAIDTGYDASRSKNDVREKSIQQRRSEDRSRSAEVMLNMDALFRPVILDLEKDVEPWCSCRVLSHPLLPADVGLSAMDEDGFFIDTIKSQYLSEAAQSNADIGDLADETKLLHYRDCLALYGAVIGEAYQKLRSSLPKVAQVVDGKSAAIVSGLTRDDIQTLSRIAIEQTLVGAVRDKRIRKLFYAAVDEQTPCRFGGHIQHFVCGSVGIIIGLQPRLHVGGVEMFGDRFAGQSGNIVVRASKNESREKVRRLAQSWSRERRQYFNVSVGKLIPGLHQ